MLPGSTHHAKRCSFSGPYARSVTRAAVHERWGAQPPCPRSTPSQRSRGVSLLRRRGPVRVAKGAAHLLQKRALERHVAPHPLLFLRLLPNLATSCFAAARVCRGREQSETSTSLNGHELPRSSLNTTARPCRWLSSLGRSLPRTVRARNLAASRVNSLQVADARRCSMLPPPLPPQACPAPAQPLTNLHSPRSSSFPAPSPAACLVHGHQFPPAPLGTPPLELHVGHQTSRFPVALE